MSHTVLDQSTTLFVFILTNTKLGEEVSPEALSPQEDSALWSIFFSVSAACVSSHLINALLQQLILFAMFEIPLLLPVVVRTFAAF